MSQQPIWTYDTPGREPGEGPPSAGSDPGDTVGWLWQEPEQLSGGLLVLRSIVGNENAADAPWSGAAVHMGLDDVTYWRWWVDRFRSTIGETENALGASTPGWHGSETVDVDLAASPGALDSTDQTGAEAGINLALLGDEVIAFAAVSALGTNRYRLTGLVRGLFGTTAAAHGSAERFAVLDLQQHREALPDQAAGDTWYYKLASLNIVGAEQDLSDVTADTITPSAVGASGEYWVGTKEWQTGVPYGDLTYSGLTIGHVLRAASASSAVFAQLSHADLGSVTSDQHHNRGHTLLNATDHTDVATYLSQALLTTSTPRFARLGLGQAADASAVMAATGQYYSLAEAHGNSGSAHTINWNDSNVQTITLSATCVLTFSNPKTGGRYVLIVAKGATAYTITWPATVTWPGGTAPTITASKTHVFGFVYDGAKYRGGYGLDHTT